MLFVKRKYQIVKNLTARHGRIVSEYRIQKPCAVFKLAVFSDNEAHRNRLIKDAAAGTHNAVYHFDAFADLRRLSLRREHCDVFQFERAFDVRAFSDFRIF